MGIFDRAKRAVGRASDRVVSSLDRRAVDSDGLGMKGRAEATGREAHEHPIVSPPTIGRTTTTDGAAALIKRDHGTIT